MDDNDNVDSLLGKKRTILSRGNDREGGRYCLDLVPACCQQIERLVCAQYCRVKVVLVAVLMYMGAAAAAAAVNRFASTSPTNTNLVDGRTKTVRMIKERVDMKQSRR